MTLDTTIKNVRSNYPKLKSLNLSLIYIAEVKINKRIEELLLGLKSNVHVTSLVISLPNFTPTLGQSLEQVLTWNTTLTLLSIETSKVHPDALESMASGLKANKTLTSVSMYSRTVTDNVCKALMENPKLRSLTFKQYTNFFALEGLKSIFSSLSFNTSLVVLSVDGWVMRTGQISMLARALRTNTTLARLTLARCGIDGNGMIDLARMLSVNTTLTTLNMPLNKWNTGVAVNNWGGAIPFFQLAQAMKYNSTLSRADIRLTIKHCEWSKTISRAAYRNRTLYDLLIEAWRRELYVGDKPLPFAKKQRIN